MYRGHSIAVVIPAYNEEGFVGEVIETVPTFVDRVYVVDDCSTDETGAEIREAATRVNERRASEPERFGRVVVPIWHDRNRGVGGAIKTGYRRARDDGVDVTTVMGGDGQMDPDVLPRLLDPIIEGRADYAKGNRFLDRTGRGDMPAFRFVGNAILGALTKIASGYWRIGDPQSGYTAISLRALERARVDEMYEFYGYCNDLLVKLNVADVRVVDVPQPIEYGDEESHISYSTYIPRVSAMLFRNFLWRLKAEYVAFDFHPLVGVYAVGSLATLAGAVGTVVAAVRGRPLGSAVAPLYALVGVLALAWAMVLDREANEGLDEAERSTDRRSAGDAERRPARPTESPAEAHNGAGRGDGEFALDEEDRVPGR